jgi:hypothetical protein
VSTAPWTTLCATWGSKQGGPGAKHLIESMPSACGSSFLDLSAVMRDRPGATLDNAAPTEENGGKS